MCGLSLWAIAEVNPRAESQTLTTHVASKHTVVQKKKPSVQTMKFCNELDNGNLCIASVDSTQNIVLAQEDAQKIFALLLLAEASKYQK